MLLNSTAKVELANANMCRGKINFMMESDI